MFKGYEQLIKKYENYRKDLPDILEREILTESAEMLQQKMTKRIFTEGLDSKGNTIAGRYSESPITVKKEVFIKPAAFKGKKKSMRLEHGYKELREIQGLKTDKVHLEYSGELRRSLKARRRLNAVVIGFSSKLSTQKARNLQHRYRVTIFRPTKEETQDHLREVNKRLRKIQREYFYGS